MKKESLLILIIFALIPLATAIDVSLSKATYYPQETLQAEITGNFFALQKEHINLYEEGIPRSTPVIEDVTFQDGIYYYYALLPNKEGNFSLVIENTDYLDQGTYTSSPLTIPFTTKRTNATALQFNPGFIFSERNIKITAKSLTANQPIEATFAATGETKKASLVEGVPYDLVFTLPNQSVNSHIVIGSYTLPVFFFGAGEGFTPHSPLQFTPNSVAATIIPKESYSFEIIVRNTGQQPIKDIILSSTLDLNITPKNISMIGPKNQTAVQVTVVGSEKNTSGTIKAQFGTAVQTLPVTFTTTDKPSTVTLTDSSATQRYRCEDIGVLCNYDANEQCSGETTASLDGPCCIGICAVPKKSNTGFYIGLVLVLVILAIVAFLIYRARKKQKPISTQDILKEKDEALKKRMDNQPKEVRGNVGNV